MSWTVVIPPLLAIIIALRLRDVISALVVALFVAEFLLSQTQSELGFINTIERIISVFASPSNVRILLFSLLVGALLNWMKQSGGVAAFVQLLTKSGLTSTPRKASFLTAVTGMVIFIETNLSILTAGILSRGTFDKLQLSRERLAFLIDASCAPIAVLILLNGWGAYLLGLLGTYELTDPLTILIKTIPLNFYAWIIILMVIYTCFSLKTFASLKDLEINSVHRESDNIPASKARYMVFPLMTMILSMLFFLWWTGEGSLLKGNGSKAVLWATVLALLVCYSLLLLDRRFSHKALIQLGIDGIGDLLILVATVLLSLALGLSLKDLGTGQYIANLMGEFLPAILLAPVVFLFASCISFTTGTSWGTFALVIPIAVPIALSFNLPMELILSAVIGGGVFGDHCSPISDTTIISSLAAGCDHMDHVRTQLPYALCAAAFSMLLYLLVGVLVLI